MNEQHSFIRLIHSLLIYSESLTTFEVQCGKVKENSGDYVCMSFLMFLDSVTLTVCIILNGKNGYWTF